MNIIFKKKLSDSSKRTDFLRRLEITLISHDLLKYSQSRNFRNLVAPDILAILGGFEEDIEQSGEFELQIR